MWLWSLFYDSVQRLMERCRQNIAFFFFLDPIIFYLKFCPLNYFGFATPSVVCEVKISVSKSWFSREHGEVDAFNRELERGYRTRGFTVRRGSFVFIISVC